MPHTKHLVSQIYVMSYVVCLINTHWSILLILWQSFSQGLSPQPNPNQQKSASSNHSELHGLIWTAWFGVGAGRPPLRFAKHNKQNVQHAHKQKSGQSNRI